MSRRLPRPLSARLVLSIVALAAVLTAWLIPVSTARAAGTTITVTIHYFRYDGNYSPWDVWSWNDSPSSGDPGTARAFNGSDSFGTYARFTQTCTSCSQVGFIIRYPDWSQREASSNGNGNRYITYVPGTTSYDAWVVTANPNTFYTLATANGAKQLSLNTAFLDSPTTITADANRNLTLASGHSGFAVRDLTTNKSLPISAVQDGYAQPGLRLAVAGTFQKKLGDTNWNANSTKTRMKQSRGGTMYAFTTVLPKGNYQYKIASPNWNSSWPTANVNLDLGGKEQVSFYYFPNNNTVEDTINNAIITFPGDPGWQTNRVNVVLKSAPNIRDYLQISASKTAMSTKLAPVTVVPRNVLSNAKYYYSGQLGAIYSASSTTFRLWAPDAAKVVLNLYNSATGPVTNSVTMTPAAGGIVQTTVSGDLAGWFYVYSVTVIGQTNNAIDPYARNVAPNGTRAMVVNLPSTDPASWNTDTHVGVTNPEDASIYEVHVRDFTINPNSGVSAANRGTYLGFTETGTTGPGGVTTGIHSLKDLGVHDVELMPTYRFATLDETQAPFAYPCPDAATANGPNSCYNWGYDPANYNVPEGAYATSVDGNTRITEFKQMVQSIHTAGMGVILDSVYNHVYDTSVFNNIVPGYYFRTDALGNYYNGSGQGNEVATDKPMVFKFAEDSMEYWMTEYHVDGFRLDEMFLFGKTQLKQVMTALKAIDPGVIVLGEPWGNPASGLPQSQQLTAGNQAGVGVGLFNADFRNAICCNTTQQSYGFANDQGVNTGAVEEGIVGSINYSNSLQDWASTPADTINYVSCHDNYTLWDLINHYTNSSDSAQDKVLEDELAQALVVTSQGIPYIQGGEEFLRTKGTGPNNGNSFDGGDADNQFDWSLKNTNINVFNYYAGLFHLRNAHPAFRMTTAAAIKSNLTFLTSPSDTISYELNGTAAGDSWSKIILMFNPTKTNESFTVPSGTWNIVGDQGQVGTSTLGTTGSGSLQVPALTTEILYQ
jgi:pullulanase